MSAQLGNNGSGNYLHALLKSFRQTACHKLSGLLLPIGQTHIKPGCKNGLLVHHEGEKWVRSRRITAEWYPFYVLSFRMLFLSPRKSSPNACPVSQGWFSQTPWDVASMYSRCNSKKHRLLSIPPPQEVAACLTLHAHNLTVGAWTHSLRTTALASSSRLEQTVSSLAFVNDNASPVDFHPWIKDSVGMHGWVIDPLKSIEGQGIWKF